MTPTHIIRPIRAVQIALIAVIASFALAACGSSVDVPGLEKSIKSSLPGDVKDAGIHSDLKVATVSCPKNPDAADGSKFDCDFTLEDDSKGVVTAIVDGEDVNYKLKRYAAGQISDDIANSYAKDGKLTAECEDPINDGTVCDFEDEDGATGKITVSVGDGRLEYSPKYD